MDENIFYQLRRNGFNKGGTFIDDTSSHTFTTGNYGYAVEAISAIKIALITDAGISGMSTVVGGIYATGTTIAAGRIIYGSQSGITKLRLRSGTALVYRL